MQRTRTIDIADRAFTIDDLRRFAKILDDHVHEGAAVQFSAKYEVIRWLMGFFWASGARAWILSAWPSIEFDFGSQYLRPVNKRDRIYALWAFAIAPILTAAVYDFVKKMVK
jgi:hypothetical protein